MMLHKNIYGAGTIFYTMAGPLVKNSIEKWLGVIRIGTYQVVFEDIK